MKFTREDIEKVYKTSVMEESLLVFQAEGDHAGYIEYAVVKVPATKIDVREIHSWIDHIPRFRDVYIHENDAPLRIRFKKNFYPVYAEELDSIRCTDDVYNCLISRNIRFDVQHPPLFRVDLFYSGLDTYVGLTYHHILFDGVSVQMALSKLDPSSSIEFTEWTPALSSESKTELIFP